MALTPPAPLSIFDSVTTEDNDVWDRAAPRLSIVIPVYRQDCTPLVAALMACDRAADVELILHDDGSGDEALLRRLRNAIRAVPAAARLSVDWRNQGPAAARNAAARQARADWILFLDADRLPDGPDFLSRWLQAFAMTVQPSVVVGGGSLRHTPRSSRHAFHRRLLARTECLPATARSRAASQHVWTGNVAAHRAIVADFPFDKGFSGRIWQDLDWGLAVGANHPVIHIDNPAGRLSLETAAELLRQNAGGVADFARLVQQRADAIQDLPAYCAAKAARRMPFRGISTSLTGGLARLGVLPMALRTWAFQRWRALICSRVL